MNEPNDESTTPSGCRTARDWNIHQALDWIVFRGNPMRFAQPHDQKYADALIVMNDAVGQGLLAAYGRPSNTWNEPVTHQPRQQIPSEIIDERRGIDAFGWYRLRIDELNFSWMKDPGPFFYDVCFRIAEMKKVWPSHAGSAQSAIVPQAAAVHAQVADDKPLPLPSDHPPWADLPSWLRNIYCLTEIEMRDVRLELRRLPPTYFRVSYSAEDDEIIWNWSDWAVTGRPGVCAGNNPSARSTSR